MFGLIIAAVVALFLVMMYHAADWAGVHVLWIGLVMLALGWGALGLHHRRKLAELAEIEHDLTGRFRRVSLFLPWPKSCRDCGMTAHDWRAIRAHGDPAWSSCAAHTTRAEAAAARARRDEVTEWSATVVGGAGSGAVDTTGSGAVDTLSEGPKRPELEAET